MTVCPFAIMDPVANHSGVMSAHRGLAVHVQVGSGSCYREFNNPASQASSTWQCMKDGTLFQFVDADYIAWTEMAGNPDYDSVETEGTPDEPLTPAQCFTLAKLIAWGHKVYGWPLVLVDHGGSGITTHAHYPSGAPDPAWGGHPCPGSIRSAQLPGIVAAAKTLVAPPPPTPAPSEEDDMAIAEIWHDNTRQYLVWANGTKTHVPDPASGSALETAPAFTFRQVPTELLDAVKDA
jgi:hypothetical protein